MRIQKKLVGKIITDPELKKKLLDTLDTQSGTPYRHIIMEVLPGENLHKMKNSSLKGIVSGVLKKMLEFGEISEEDVKKYEIERKSAGGIRGVKQSQKVQGLKPLTKEERAFLSMVGSKSEEYKLGSNRNITKIIEDMYRQTGILRTNNYIQKYMRENYTTEKRIVLMWEEGEKEMIRIFFKKNYKIAKKLPPLQGIVDEINAVYGNSRTTEAVSQFIRAYLRPETERQEVVERTQEEKSFLKQIVSDENYRHKEGKSKGKYKMSEIKERYDTMFPGRSRTIKSLMHQIKKL